MRACFRSVLKQWLKQFELRNDNLIVQISVGFGVALNPNLSRSRRKRQKFESHSPLKRSIKRLEAIGFDVGINYRLFALDAFLRIAVFHSQHPTKLA